jgi:hypothetical protein
MPSGLCRSSTIVGSQNIAQAPHTVLALEYALLVFDALLATVISGTRASVGNHSGSKIPRFCGTNLRRERNADWQIRGVKGLSTNFVSAPEVNSSEYVSWDMLLRSFEWVDRGEHRRITNCPLTLYPPFRLMFPVLEVLDFCIFGFELYWWSRLHGFDVSSQPRSTSHTRTCHHENVID